MTRRVYRPAGRLNCPTRWFAAESAISIASRRSRVSGFFALITQCDACRRYDGACASNHSRPAARLGPEPLAECLVQLGRHRLLVRVERHAVRAPRLERAAARIGHQPRGLQLGHLPDVDGAPDRPRPPRREADRVRRLVEAAPHAVDPPEAECDVDGLGPRDAGQAGAAPAIRHEQLGRRLVVDLEPGAEGGLVLEEVGLGRVRQRDRSRRATRPRSPPSSSSRAAPRRRRRRSRCTGRAAHGRGRRGTSRRG